MNMAMKQVLSITVAAICVVFMAAQSSPKGGGEGKPIPEDVSKIMEKSCFDCHNKGGNPMAMEHWSLAKWNEYSAEKQASKAKAMCDMVTKEKMPPKSFREAHPAGAPSEEEIKIICNWAASIQPVKK